MKTKQSRILLVLIATLLIYLMCFSLFGCQEPQVLPTCDFVEAKYSEGRMSIKIHSESPFVTICRDFETRTQCANYTKEYFNCIRMSVDYGEIITFIDRYECTVEAR